MWIFMMVELEIKSKLDSSEWDDQMDMWVYSERMEEKFRQISELEPVSLVVKGQITVSLGVMNVEMVKMDRTRQRMLEDSVQTPV